MTENYAFNEDQREPRVAKCLYVIVLLIFSDPMFIRRSEAQLNTAAVLEK